MKHYKVSEARAHFGDLLDAAERGDAVVIERHGVEFTLSAQPSAARPRPAEASVAFVDRDIMSGQWTWASSAKGLKFRPRRHR